MYIQVDFIHRYKLYIKLASDCKLIIISVPVVFSPDNENIVACFYILYTLKYIRLLNIAS